MARTGYQADQGGRYYLNSSLKVHLTKPEKEWLGRSVSLPDGRVGQVWALHPERDYVWVAAEGTASFGVHTSELVHL